MVTEAWLQKSGLITGNLTGSSPLGQLIFSVISLTNSHETGILVGVTCCRRLTNVTLTTLSSWNGAERCGQMKIKPRWHRCKAVKNPHACYNLNGGFFRTTISTTQARTRLLRMYAGKIGRSAVMHNATQAVGMMCHEERAELDWQHVPQWPHTPADASLGHAG